MKKRRPPWQLVAGGLFVVGGAAILLLVLVDRTQEPSRPRATASPHGFGEIAVRVTDSAGTTRRWCLLAARTEGERERGLMQVRDRTLGGHDGMAFLFAHDTRVGFWMRDTPMPLSIAYLDRAGEVVSVADMTPCRDSPDCPSYPAAGPYRAAVEVPRGGLARLGVEAGSHTAFGGRCTGSAQSG